MFIRSNKMQQYAVICLLQNHSTCFGCAPNPSSGVHKTVIAASGTGQITYHELYTLCNCNIVTLCPVKLLLFREFTVIFWSWQVRKWENGMVEVLSRDRGSQEVYFVCWGFCDVQQIDCEF